MFRQYVRITPFTQSSQIKIGTESEVAAEMGKPAMAMSLSHYRDRVGYEMSQKQVLGQVELLARTHNKISMHSFF
jgi:hypothetical protein